MIKVRTKTVNMQKMERIQRVGDTADLPLFDGKPDPLSYIFNDGIDERDQAHDTLKNCNHRELLVLGVLRERGPLTDLQIADVLKWKINQVTGRRNALLEKRRIEKYGSVKNEGTGKMNSLWRAI